MEKLMVGCRKAYGKIHGKVRSWQGMGKSTEQVMAKVHGKVWESS